MTTRLTLENIPEVTNRENYATISEDYILAFRCYERLSGLEPSLDKPKCELEATSGLDLPVSAFDKLSINHDLGSNDHDQSVSPPYYFRVIVSYNTDLIDLFERDLVTANATFSIETDAGVIRTFKGIILRSMRRGSESNEQPSLEICVYPFLWAMSVSQKSRVWSNVRAYDVLERLNFEYSSEINGLPDILDQRPATTTGNPARTNAIQWNESDFEFLSRLLEKDGEYYAFDHTTNKIILLSSNSPALTGLVEPSADFLSFLPYQALQDTAYSDTIFSCIQENKLVPKKYSTKGYNHTNAGTPLEISSRTEYSSFEVYEYPANVENLDDLSPVSTRRINALRARHSVYILGSKCPMLSAGHQVSANVDLLISPISLRVTQVVHEVIRNENGSARYFNWFEGMPDDTLYSPSLRTPIPSIYGTHNAVVIVQNGMVADIDADSRALVKFHWDRENVPVRVRLGQPWAGSKHGMSVLPRGGDEVIISFIQGDTERPIILTNVHNSSTPKFYDPNRLGTKYSFLKNADRGVSPETSVTQQNSSVFTDYAGNGIILNDQPEKEITKINAYKDFILEVGHKESLDVAKNFSLEFSMLANNNFIVEETVAPGVVAAKYIRREGSSSHPSKGQLSYETKTTGITISALSAGYSKFSVEIENIKVSDFTTLPGGQLIRVSIKSSQRKTGTLKLFSTASKVRVNVRDDTGNFSNPPISNPPRPSPVPTRSSSVPVITPDTTSGSGRCDLVFLNSVMNSADIVPGGSYIIKEIGTTNFSELTSQSLGENFIVPTGNVDILGDASDGMLREWNRGPVKFSVDQSQNAQSTLNLEGGHSLHLYYRPLLSHLRDPSASTGKARLISLERGSLIRHPSALINRLGNDKLEVTIPDWDNEYMLTLDDLKVELGDSIQIRAELDVGSEFTAAEELPTDMGNGKVYEIISSSTPLNKKIELFGREIQLETIGYPNYEYTVPQTGYTDTVETRDSSGKIDTLENGSDASFESDKVKRGTGLIRSYGDFFIVVGKKQATMNELYPTDINEKFDGHIELGKRDGLIDDGNRGDLKIHVMGEYDCFAEAFYDSNYSPTTGLLIDAEYKCENALGMPIYARATQSQQYNIDLGKPNFNYRTGTNLEATTGSTSDFLFGVTMELQDMNVNIEMQGLLHIMEVALDSKGMKASMSLGIKPIGFDITADFMELEYAENISLTKKVNAVNNIASKSANTATKTAVAAVSVLLLITSNAVASVISTLISESSDTDADDAGKTGDDRLKDFLENNLPTIGDATAITTYCLQGIIILVGLIQISMKALAQRAENAAAAAAAATNTPQVAPGSSYQGALGTFLQSEIEGAKQSLHTQLTSQTDAKIALHNARLTTAEQNISANTSKIEKLDVEIKTANIKAVQQKTKLKKIEIKVNNVKSDLEKTQNVMNFNTTNISDQVVKLQKKKVQLSVQFV